MTSAPLSAEPAERSTQNLREKNRPHRTSVWSAENGLFLRNFLRGELTGWQGEDCYTFEGFAPNPDVIRTTYYHYYQETKKGLKEETTWS